MSLTTKLYSKSEIESKAKAFAQKELESILSGDAGSKFDTPELQDRLYIELRDGYANHMSEYNGGSFGTKYVTPTLRAAGAVLDAYFTGMFFNPLTIGAGVIGKATISLPIKTLADAIESRYLHNYLSTNNVRWSDRVKADAKATGEALVERTTSLLPIGAEAVDYIRGPRRWYNAAEGAMADTIRREAMERAVPKEGKIIPLSAFRVSADDAYRRAA